MKFNYEETVSYPIDLVWQTLRDGVTELVPQLPSVDSIDEVERVRTGSSVYVVLAWQGSSEGAPKAVRPFINPEMTRWRDYATWNDDTHEVEWRFETEKFDRLYTCSGINYFEPDGQGSTVIRLTGDLEVYPENVPGVPKMLARRLRPTIEQFLIGMITPNLADLPRALQSHLDQA